MNCQKCGNVVPNNSKFCPSCGNPIVVEPVITNKKKININHILIGLISLVVVVIVFVGVFALVNSNRTRTIMIYMVGADLESGSGLATRDLSDLDYNKIKANNTKVILMAGGSKGWHNNYIDSTKTAIYELTANGFAKVDNHDLSNMGQAENLSYFLNYGYKNYKSSKYNLIFWNHGGAVDGSEYDELNRHDNLSIPEFKEAFDNSPFKNHKLDVISFRTCLNSTIEVANTLKHYAKYMVASEEVTVGSKKASALTYLNSVKPSDKPLEFGKKQIEGYKSSVTDTCNYMMDSDLDVNICVNYTYSVIDLSKIDEVNKNLDNFSNDINNKIITNYNDIVKVRAALNQYPNDDLSYDMVDLVDLTTKLKKYSSNSDKLLKSITEAVVYNSTNNEYSNGLSIYFPYNSSDFLKIYPSISSSSNYNNMVNNFYNKKSGVKSNAFDNFSMKKADSKKTESGDADFEISLSDDQVKNYASAVCYVFVDMKDGYHKLVYLSRSPYLEGNKLKVKVNGKMLRMSDSEYEDLDSSEWLQLVEQEAKDDYVESNSVFILDYGLKRSDVVTATIRIDKDHPNGYIKSLVTTSKDDTKSVKYLSENMVKLTDYATVKVANQSYKITDDNGRFNSNFLSAGNGVYTGKYFATNAIKLIKEDFNSEYDYYGVFAVKDISGSLYYSDIVKMN